MNKVAFLWWENEVKFKREAPFVKQWKNQDYAEYTEMLEERGIKVFCSEFREYDSGVLKKAFHWNGEEWEKAENIEIDGAYDLFRHDKEKYELKKKMKEEVGIINDPEVAELCQDKLRTYKEFTGFLPKTKKATKKNIRELLEVNPRVVLKPRYGSSGEDISIVDEVPRQVPDNMLVQRFMESDDLPEYGIEGPHDLRILMVNGDPIGAYFRVPDEGLLSNVALGGQKIYVELENLPEKIFSIVERVTVQLEEYEPNIYTVDFMFSEGSPWIVELNSQPGIYYHGEGRKEEWERPWMKKLCDTIAEKFS